MIAILNEGIEGLVQATDVASIAAASQGWHQEIERLGPWQLSRVHGFEQPLWVSAQPGWPELLLLVGACTSCMDVAWHFHSKGALSPPSAVLTVSQWAGRGQLGRPWFSPSGNLYGAWLLSVPELLEVPISLLMGYATVRVLIDLGLRVELKWPNDVLVDGRKIAGVLFEQRAQVGVVGVGINLLHSPSQAILAETSGMPAAALADHGVCAGPVEVWLRLLETARQIVGPGGAEKALTSIEQHLAYKGRLVRVVPWTGEPRIGRLVGLDPKGALVLTTAAGTQTVSSATLWALE